MMAMTPMSKLIRRGRFIYTVDTVGVERLVATGETLADTKWVFGPLARFHESVDVLDSDVEPDDERGQHCEGDHLGFVPAVAALIMLGSDSAANITFACVACLETALRDWALDAHDDTEGWEVRRV